MKYTDYVASRDGSGETTQNLEKELVDAQEQSAQRRESTEFEVPERFANKSSEDIAQSYVELERKFSQQGNDLGQMRRTVDQLIALQSQPAPEAVATPEPVTADDLYIDPHEAISRTAQEAINPQLNAMQNELNFMRERIVEQDLTSKYPEWKDQTQSNEFQDWVKSKPYRQRLAIAAAQQDTDAADELLDMYNDTLQSDGGKADQERQRDLSNASLERGGSHQSVDTSDDFISRQDLMEKKIAAKRGDDAAERWLNDNGQAIASAYAEGRVRD